MTENIAENVLEGITGFLLVVFLIQSILSLLPGFNIPLIGTLLFGGIVWLTPMVILITYQATERKIGVGLIYTVYWFIMVYGGLLTAITNTLGLPDMASIFFLRLIGAVVGGTMLLQAFDFVPAEEKAEIEF